MRSKFFDIEHSTDLVQIHGNFLKQAISKWRNDPGFKVAISRGIFRSCWNFNLLITGSTYNLLDSAQ
jgi:hypothetical protein